MHRATRMSTRADFYVGRGLSSTWVGSIGHDAFVENLEPYFQDVATEADFRAALARVFADYGEISADNGWPWPWSSSKGTGTVLAFDDGRVWVSLLDQPWAPLADWEAEGGMPCVFPDMVGDEASTPEGKLRQDLRRQTLVRLKPGTPVLPSLLSRLAYVLDRAWMHSHVAEGQLRMLSPQTQLQDEIFDLSRVLRAHADTVRALVDTQQAVDGEDAWDLVRWACEDMRPYFGHDTVRVDLTDELPVHFGQPIVRPVAKNTRLPSALNLHFLVLDDALSRGRELLDKVLDRCPFVHAYALAHEMRLHGVLPVKADAMEAWVDEPHPDLEGQSWRTVSATAAGRCQANRAAARYVWTS